MLLVSYLFSHIGMHFWQQLLTLLHLLEGVLFATLTLIFGIKFRFNLVVELVLLKFAFYKVSENFLEFGLVVGDGAELLS